VRINYYTAQGNSIEQEEEQEQGGGGGEKKTDALGKQF